MRGDSLASNFRKWDYHKINDWKHSGESKIVWDGLWQLRHKREFSVSRYGRVHLEDRPWTLDTQQVTGGPGQVRAWPGTLGPVRQQWHNGTDTMGAEASQTRQLGKRCVHSPWRPSHCRISHKQDGPMLTRKPQQGTPR